MVKRFFPLFFYFVLSFIIWGYMVDFDFFHKINISPDPSFYLWAFKWWIYAISNNINPFLTYAFWAPFGQNLAWVTAVPSIAFLMAPITYIFNPVMSFHIITIISLALSCYGIYLINRELGASKKASFVSGFIFFFSTYLWGHMLGHLNLYVVFPVIYLIYLFILMFKNKIGYKKYIVISSLLFTFQFGISNEIYATFVIFGFISIFIGFLIFKEYRYQIVKSFIYTIISIIFSAIFLSPYLYYIFKGQIKDSINDPSFYSIDPLNFIIPTQITFLFSDIFSNISEKFTGNVAEQTSYFGLPILFIIFTFIYFAFKNKNRFFIYLSILFIVFSTLSLGPYLNILQKKLFIMPAYIFTKLPLINHALPDRFSFYTWIVVAIIVAFWFDKYAKSVYRYIVTFLAVLFLIPNFKFYKGEEISYPQFITTGVYKQYIKKGDNLLIFPTYDQYGTEAQLWQIYTDFYFNISQQLAGVPPKELTEDEKARPALEKIIRAKNIPSDLDPQLKYSFLYYLKKCNVSAILIPDYYKNENLTNMLNQISKSGNISGVIFYKIDKKDLDKKLTEAEKALEDYYLKIFATLYNQSLKFLSDKNNPDNLYPEYLIKTGYLDSSFGYETGEGYNWTKNGGWIGKWICPENIKDSICFGIGIVTDYKYIKPIIQQYQDKALIIYFPYPKIYKSDNEEKEGQLLIVFKF